MEYDVFRPTGSGGVIVPPFTITVMKADGSFTTKDIKSRSDLDVLRPYLVYKIHKPDPMKLLIDEARVVTGVSTGSIRLIFSFLQKKGVLKVDGQPSVAKCDWLDEKMDELSIRYENQRKNVRNWFNDPERWPEVNFDIGNQILAVKSVAGGRVVVLPTGHTIAYSKAKEIYNDFMGKYSYYHGDRVSVGEYSSGRITYRRHRLTIEQRGITVGCQFVPRQAILDLAKREGWN